MKNLENSNVKQTVKDKFGVLAWPAYATKAGNPYNYLIYTNIEKQGYPVYEFEYNIKNVLKFLFSGKYRIFHIHWPTNILTYSTYLQAKRRVLILKYFLKIIKAIDKKVVWTVHNLQAHENTHPSLQKELNTILYTYVDGFISLNKNGLDLIKQKALNKDRQIFSYIPHPYYTGYYPNNISREDARKQLNIGNNKFVFLFLGQIRKYKNILGLIKAYKEAKIDDKFLLIAGKAHEELAEDLNKAVKNQADIILKDSFIADEDLQLYLNACDLVITPYNNIFNSGSIFMNLSFHKATLAPRKSVFIELEEELGSDYILLYNNELSPQHLEHSMEKINKKSSKNPDLIKFSPENIANQTISLYRQLLFS